MYFKNSTPTSSNSSSTMNKVCKICESAVRARKTYTPNICEACQKFFRRNVGKWDELVCTTGQFNCKVAGGRRWCGKCRFEKCLRNGMKSKFMKGSNEADGEGEMEMEMDGSSGNSNNQSLASSPLAVVTYQQSPPYNVDQVAPGNDRLSPLMLETAPFDYTFNSAERFLKACLTAYTELSGIDHVCSLQYSFL